MSNSNSISDAALGRALRPFGCQPAPELAGQIRTYLELLLKWNQKVNLTSITSPAEILTRHFGESLFALPFLPSGAGTLLDIGSGAGFPGMVLAMARRELEVTLSEPVMKKVTFLKEVARSIGCGVKVEAQRAESLQIETGFHCITIRAVRLGPELLDWVRGALIDGGTFIAWLGVEDARVTQLNKGFAWAEKHIPGSDQRVLLVGHKA